MAKAKRGTRVEYTGGDTPRLGTVTSWSRRGDGYVLIKLDGDKRPRRFHPEWELIYLLTRDGARAAFAASGLEIAGLNADDYVRLRSYINWEFMASKVMDDTLRIDGRRSSGGWIRCRSFYFDNREAVTFEAASGWIGFAGWSDDRNVQPILKAFHYWIGKTVAAHAAEEGEAA